MSTEFEPKPPGPDSSPSLVCVDSALVVPPRERSTRRSQPSGVLTCEGDVVPEAITWRRHAQLTLPPKRPREEKLRELSGTWLFLGPLIDHFGHVLLEGLARTWAIDRLGDEIAGVVYLPHRQGKVEDIATAFLPMLKQFGVTMSARIIERPTRVERLYVPSQALGMGELTVGTPELRAFIRRHAGAGIAPRGAERIYVSRTDLRGNEGSILGEGALVELLKAEGYEAYHPQKHSFVDQIAAYKAATHIVSTDSSPLHLVAYVGSSSQKVGVISRRSSLHAQQFAQQVRAFSGAEAHVLNLLVRNWCRINAKPKRAMVRSWGEVDFAALGEGLKRVGLIEGGTGWTALAEAEVKEQIQGIEAAHRCRYEPLRVT